MRYANNSATPFTNLNVAVGFEALRGSIIATNNTGNSNTALGYQTLRNTTTGAANTASGESVLFSNTTGNSNTASGQNALFSNTIGNSNTASGIFALYSNTTGDLNTACGRNALYTNVAGSNATAVGYGAMRYANNSAIAFDNYNVAVGFEALRGSTTAANNTGFNNTALGYQTLWSNTTGFMNTANGYRTLYSNTTGYANTANGQEALFSNISGFSNTASGKSALFSNTTGDKNTASGLNALYYNLTGFNNTASGYEALYSNDTGDDNTAIGYGAGRHNTAGNRNTAIGYDALLVNTAGDNNTAVGYNADVSSGVLNNATAIGNTATVNASNKVRIGNGSVTVVEGQVAYSFPSDGRFKYNITESDVKGLEFIKLLHPVEYNFDTKKFEEFLTKNMPDSIRAKHFENTDFSASSSLRQSGFVAQEVEEAMNQSGYNFNGVHTPADENDNYSVAYSLFVVPLVKAVQELKLMSDEKDEKIKNLESSNDEMKNEIADMKKQMHQFEKAISEYCLNFKSPAENSQTGEIDLPRLEQIKCSK